MAAKGTVEKQEIFNKLLEVFPGSFMQDDKILRIPMNSSGEPVEIKVTLTAAKDLLGAGAAQTDSKTQGEFNWDDPAPSSVETAAANSPSTEEKENIRKMMEALGL